MKKIGIGTGILLTLLVPIFAFAYASPGKPTGYVNDFAKILSPSDAAQIETILSNYEKQSGNEIAVVTVPSLGGETIETYAVDLFQEWGIGQKGKDNGLLLLIAPMEHQMRIEVGYGLEPYITDAQSASIIKNILTPAFKNNDYAGGITQAISTLIQVLNGQVDAVPQGSTDSSNSNNGGWGNWIFFIIFIPIWLASILGRSKSWWAGGVLGGIAGVILGCMFGFFYIGIIAIPGLIILGLIFDFVVSKAYANRVGRGLRPPWWIGGGGFGGRGGGGFGGFGGGGSGGGGASGGW